MIFFAFHRRCTNVIGCVSTMPCEVKIHTITCRRGPRGENELLYVRTLHSPSAARAARAMRLKAFMVGMVFRKLPCWAATVLLCWKEWREYERARERERGGEGSDIVY